MMHTYSMYHERESLSIGGAGGHFLLSKPSFSREYDQEALGELLL
jgi:hypothetical protein